ncbi:MAG: hypothetical protein ABL973_16490 [Micropepsaceae bacterium]
MSDTIQLVPSVPVVARPAPVRADQHVEPPKQSQTDNRSATDGHENDHHADQPARHLTISKQDELGSFVYRSIDSSNGDVVWQYPSESVLRMSQRLQELEEQNARHQVDQKA